MIFQRDTILYHAVEGAKNFPAGEQHPGGAWGPMEGGPGPDTSADTEALKASLSAAKIEVGRLTSVIERKDASLAEISGKRSALADEVAELKGEAADAKAAEKRALDDAKTLTRERDDARGTEAALRATIAALEAAAAKNDVAGLRERITELETDVANANTQRDEANELMAAFDGDGDKRPGGSKSKTDPK